MTAVNLPPALSAPAAALVLFRELVVANSTHPNNMLPRFLLLVIAHGLLLCSYGQSNALVVLATINLPRDAATKSLLLDSLNGFLAQKENPVRDNPFVQEVDRLETGLLLEELSGMEQSSRYKDAHFYKPYLLNCAPLNHTGFLVQLAYIGQLDNVPTTRAQFRLLAKQVGHQFYFSSPLKQNTTAWQHQQIGSCQFFFKRTLNTSKATEYAKAVAAFDLKLKGDKSQLALYCCDHFPEVMQLIGVDYKTDYNGSGSSSLSTCYGSDTLIVNSTGGAEFNNFDPHDLWHERLQNVMAREVVNKPVDEGCAYLYGGSWGISWSEILKSFKAKNAGRPETDWLRLYEDLHNFADVQEKHLIATYVINALLVQKIEKEHGFAGVMKLLGCGKYEKGNANYFEVLEKLTGINRSNFNAEIEKLVKAS